MASPQYTFGAYTFNPITGELRKHDISVKLQRKPQHVLVALLERAGEPVSRQELHVRLWHGDTFVDFEQGLNVAVKKLRDALCDSADEPRYVQTVPGIGYRFIGQLEVVPAATQQPAAAPVSVSAFAPAVSAEFEKPNLSTTTSTRWVRASVALISAVVLAIAVFAASSGLRHGHAKPMRVTLSFEPEVRMVTIGDEAGLALSPDGRRVVFSAMGQEGRTKLWLRRLDVLQPEPLPGTESGSFPFWAPAGDKLGFFADNKLKWLNLADGTITVICDAENGRGGSWSKDGEILFAPGTQGVIYRVKAGGGQAAAVTSLKGSEYTTHRWPEFLPDGSHFVFLAANHQESSVPAAIFLGSLDGSPSRFIAEGDANAEPVGNLLVYVSGGKLISQPLNVERGALEAKATILAEGIEGDRGSWYANFTAAKDALVYKVRADGATGHVIAYYDAQGNHLRNLGRGAYFSIALSPDGSKVATICGDPDMNVCLVRDDGSVTQLTNAPLNYPPAWSPDSSQLAYVTHRGHDAFTVVVRSIDPGAPERELMRSPQGLNALSWHPDGEHLLIMRQESNRGELWTVDVRSGAGQKYFPGTPGLLDAQVSPDGLWVAYQAQSSGSDEVYVSSYPEPAVTYRVSTNGGSGPRWRGDGRELYFLGSGKAIFAVPVSSLGRHLKLGEPRWLFQPRMLPEPWDRLSYDVDRSGKRFVMSTVDPKDRAELVLLTNWNQ